MKLYREITPIQPKDFFGIYDYPEASFNYPLHSHPEYEINMVMNGAGNRVVGDKIDKYEGMDLVLLGPNISHCWDNVDAHKKGFRKTSVIFIQFDEHLFDQLQHKEVFYPIQLLLQYANRGVEFHGNTVEQTKQKMQEMTTMPPFEASLEFLKLLHTLANSEEKRLIASPGYSTSIIPKESRRIEEVYAFIKQNFHNPITLKEVAAIANMSESAFSHYFKRSTNRSFIKFLTEIRLSHASRLLTTTLLSVSEIAFQSGYTNLSNFNRLFKKYKDCTPLQFRNKIEYATPAIQDRFLLD